MARLPKLGQRVDCTLPGYEDADIYMSVWVNAPQNVFDNWQQMLDDAKVKDEKGNQAFELNADGSPVIDPETFEPVEKIDRDRIIRAAKFYVETLILEFSLTEDLEGNPLRLGQPDFWERLPEDLISWINDGVAQAIAERRKQGKTGASLQGIIGR